MIASFIFCMIGAIGVGLCLAMLISDRLNPDEVNTWIILLFFNTIGLAINFGLLLASLN